jgi:hypothetical protein
MLRRLTGYAVVFKDFTQTGPNRIYVDTGIVLAARRGEGIFHAMTSLREITASSNSTNSRMSPSESRPPPSQNVPLRVDAPHVATGLPRTECTFEEGFTNCSSSFSAIKTITSLQLFEKS